MLGGTKQFGIGKDLSGLRKLMMQLGAISRQIMKTGRESGGR